MFAAGARAETGIVTLVEGSPRLLRGATWYKLVAATRVEEADIVEAPDRAQAQIELAAGSVANLVGAGKLHFVPRQAKSPLPLLNMPAGWLKVVAKAPGVRVRTLPFDLVIVEGIAVVRADGATIEFLANFLKILGLDTRLREHGVRTEHLDQLVEQAWDDPCHKTNAVPVTREDLRQLYLEVL